jgi:hypothetical protein
MGAAALEIRRERGYCSEKGCVCVCGFVRDCFVFFLRCIGFGFSYSFQEPSARSVKEFNSRSPSDSFYVSRAG